MINKYLLLYLFASVSAFVFMLWFIGFNEVANAFFNLSVFWLILVGLLVPLQFLVRTFRWHLILKPVSDRPVSISLLFPWVVFGDFINLILPVGAMGAVFKSAFFSRFHSQKFSAVLSTVTVERVFDGFIASLLGILGIVMLGFTVENGLIQNVMYLMLGLSVFAFFMIWLVKVNRIFVVNIFNKVFSFLPLKFSSKIIHFMDGLIEGLSGIRYDKNTFAMFIFTCFRWVIRLASNIFLFTAASESINLGVIFAGTSMIALAMLIPSTPARIGAFELLWTGIFGFLLGVPLDKAVSMGIANHIVEVLILASLGVASISKIGLSISNLKLNQKIISWKIIS